MAYNKAKEERKWRLWKEAEEKQLRNLGVTEDDIEQLRIHDWAIFNSDRRCRGPASLYRNVFRLCP